MWQSERGFSRLAGGRKPWSARPWQTESGCPLVGDAHRTHQVSRHASGSIDMRASLTQHMHTQSLDRTGITHSMQASLVARLPLVSRSHWQPTHGKQPILLKKGTLGSGPSTHIMPVGMTKRIRPLETETHTKQRRKLGQSDPVARVGLSLFAPHLRHRAIMALPACMFGATSG